MRKATFAFALAAAAPVGVTAQSAPLPTTIWQSFGDTVLVRLVDQALRANTDVRVAQARLASARASRQLSFFDLAPTVTARGSTTHQRFSMSQVPGATSPVPTQEYWDAGFDASWEIDIFGRLTRTAAAQNAYAAAAQHSLHDVQVSVTAEVARAYFDLRGAQRQLAVAQQSAENQRKTLSLTEQRLSAGRGTGFDTERARAVLSLTLASTPLLETRIAADQHRIAVLTGETPDPTKGTLAPSNDTLSLPDSVRIGVPEQFVRNRPDVLSAERQLAAGRLLVGAARMEYLPRLSLGASTGYNATQFDSLGGRGTSRYLVGPVVSWPFLDLGRVHTRVNAARARQDEAQAQYTAVMLRAVEETETALVAYDQSRARLKLLDEAVRASTHAAELAQQRFEAGLTDFLQVLDAQRTLLDAENQRAQGRTDAATALVALFKALGGTWPVRP